MTDSDSVVVIGSGPSGAMAAHQLLLSGVPVTMLESGSDDPRGLLVRVGGRTVFRRTPDLVLDPHYVATGNPSTLWYRTLQPGGMSNQWTGAVPRFAPEDFFDGERLHQRYRWPVDYQDLVPYYQRAESLLGITGGGIDAAQLPAGYADRTRNLPREWRRVAEVAASHGQGLTLMPLAEGPEFLAARRATAFNSYSTIVRQLMTNPKFQLRTGCTALGLEWSATHGRVTSVLFHDSATGREDRLDAPAVVVACGPLASTKLLFDSACPDFPDGLGNSAGVLGQYLHDHPKEWWSVELERPIARLGRAAYLTRRPFTDQPPLTSTSWTIGLTSGVGERIRSLVPGRTRGLGVQVFGSMVPSDKGFVRPDPLRKDQFGLPQLDIHMDFEPEVIENVVGARSRFMDLMSEAGYTCKLNPVEPQCQPGLAVHFGGTARMHRDPTFGVTDEWSRLHDAPNVVVADASTFTTSSEKNPTLTAMALAARAAERLALDLKRRFVDR